MKIVLSYEQDSIGFEAPELTYSKILEYDLFKHFLTFLNSNYVLTKNDYFTNYAFLGEEDIYIEFKNVPETDQSIVTGIIKNFFVGNGFNVSETTVKT